MNVLKLLFAWRSLSHPCCHLVLLYADYSYQTHGVQGASLATLYEPAISILQTHWWTHPHPLFLRHLVQWSEIFRFSWVSGMYVTWPNSLLCSPYVHTFAYVIQYWNGLLKRIPHLLKQFSTVLNFKYLCCKTFSLYLFSSAAMRSPLILKW